MKKIVTVSLIIATVACAPAYAKEVSYSSFTAVEEIERAPSAGERRCVWRGYKVRHKCKK